MKRVFFLVAGVLLLGLFAGCGADNLPPLELSSSQPSLLFFTTEN